MTWPASKGPGDWCPENDRAYQAEQAAIHAAAPRLWICACSTEFWRQEGDGPKCPICRHKEKQDA